MLPIIVLELLYLLNFIFVFIVALLLVLLLDIALTGAVDFVDHPPAGLLYLLDGGVIDGQEYSVDIQKGIV